MLNKLLTCLAFILAYTGLSGQGKLTVKVEPRIELLTVIQYLGDRDVYPVPSIYLREVRGYFKKYQKEPAIGKIKSILSKQSADAAFPMLGMYASTLPDFNITLPFSQLTDTVNKKEYLELCKGFAQKTKFDSFLQNDHFQMDEWVRQVKDTISRYSLTDRLESFMGQKRSWHIFLSPLVSWGAYNFILPTENEETEIYFVLGYTKYNKHKSAMNEQPFFADKNLLTDLVWHEGAHSYITPLIKRDSARIETYSYLLTDSLQKSLQQAGRFQWKWDYYLNELIVRAIVAKLMATHFGEAEAKVELEKQKSKGFIHIDRVYSLLKTYESKRPVSGQTVNDFFIVLMEDFRSWSLCLASS